jgi:hypothetical protein
MNLTEKADAQECYGATVLRGAQLAEKCRARGRYVFRCIGKDGRIKWEDTIDNVVCTEGKNLMLDCALGANVAVVGPFMGLISSVSYTAVLAADTAAQINGTNGWKEAGSGVNFPFYTTPRKTCVWSAAAAGAKALSAVLLFPIVTNAGTVKGAFIIFGTGALSTIADTNGKLWSAGLFTGGDKIVSVGDTLQASYSTSL